jgi:hypothetical protein
MSQVQMFFSLADMEVDQGTTKVIIDLHNFIADSIMTNVAHSQITGQVLYAQLKATIGAGLSANG